MPYKDPAKARECNRASAARNIDKRREYKREWKRANPEKYRASARNYYRRKLPTPTRPEPRACECCGRVPIDRALCLDHDHLTGRFRGWLCHRCNTALAALGDSYAGIAKMVRYLNRSDLT
jgi:hypothetical protein